MKGVQECLDQSEVKVPGEKGSKNTDINETV